MRVGIDQRGRQFPLTKVALKLLPQQIPVKTDAVTGAVQGFQGGSSSAIGVATPFLSTQGSYLRI
jgi:hypothetical protein